MSLTIDEPVQTNAPQRSNEQRMEALARANAIRTYRAQLKKKVRAGEVDVIPLLVDVPEVLGTMKLVELLLAMPKVGRVKANKMLQRMRISPAKTLGGLSERQRLEVLQLLADGSVYYRRRFAAS
jgi:hypothetical protein